MTVRSLSAIYLLALLLGCSGQTSSDGGSPAGAGGGGTAGNGGTGGGSAGDAGNDSPPTPSSWPVHVQVVGKPADAPALAVLVSRADGSQESVTATDASGKVDVQVPHLGSVTVFHSAVSSVPEITFQTVKTYAGVDEETTFRLEVFDSSGAQPLVADTLTFEIEPATLPTGTDRVVVQLPCQGSKESDSGPTNPIVFDSPDACPGATEYYAVALALDASGHGLAAAVLPHLAFATGAVTHTVSFDGTPFIELEPDITPLDPALDDIGVEGLAYPPDSSYGESAYIKWSHGLTHPVENQKLLLPLVTGFFERFSLRAFIWHPNVPGVLHSPVDQRFSTASTLPSTFDFAASIAPIASVANEYGDLVERPSVTFSLEPGTLGSCISARLAWQRDWSLVTFWSWTQKVAPSGAVQIPELPASLAGYGWETGSTFLSWGSGVSHVKKAVPCSDLVETDAEYSSAEAPLPTD